MFLRAKTQTSDDSSVKDVLSSEEGDQDVPALSKKDHVVSSKNEVLAVTTQIPSQDAVNQLFNEAAKKQVQSDWLGAQQSIEQALKLDPKNPYLMQTYASLLANRGDVTGAMIWIDKALAIKFDEPNFWYLKIELATVLSKSNFNNISDVYLRALEATNNNIDMITSYARFLGQADKGQESITYWQKAIELYPANKATYQAEIDRLKAN